MTKYVVTQYNPTPSCLAFVTTWVYESLYEAQDKVEELERSSPRSWHVIDERQPLYQGRTSGAV